MRWCTLPRRTKQERENACERSMLFLVVTSKSMFRCTLTLSKGGFNEGEARSQVWINVLARWRVVIQLLWWRGEAIGCSEVRVCKLTIDCQSNTIFKWDFIYIYWYAASHCYHQNQHYHSRVVLPYFELETDDEKRKNDRNPRTVILERSI